MPGGPLIKEDIKKMVAEIHYIHPDWVGKEVQTEVERMVGLDRAPKLRAIQNLLKKVREEEANNPKLMELRPWHMGTLHTHHLPAEAIPYIFKVREWAQKKKRPPLTIRQAKWIGHLYTISVGDVRQAKEKDIRDLYTRSWYYSQYETICDLAGDTNFDTSELDDAIYNGTLPDFSARLLMRNIMNGTLGHMKTASAIMSGRDDQYKR